MHERPSTEQKAWRKILDRWVTAGSPFWRRLQEGGARSSHHGQIFPCHWSSISSDTVKKHAGQAELLESYGRVQKVRFLGEDGVWGCKPTSSHFTELEQQREHQIHQSFARAPWFAGSRRILYSSDGSENFRCWPWREGKTLAEIVWEEGPAKDRESLLSRVLWMEQLLRILGEIHAKGWLHNDLKASNLLLSLEGEVVLLDWESATHLEEVAVWDAISESMDWGSPYTLAPERVQGAQPSEAAEIYALGVTFYHLFSGTWYQGKMPSLRSFCPLLPAWLDGLVERMLAYSPLQRPTLSEIQTWWRLLVRSFEKEDGESSAETDVFEPVQVPKKIAAGPTKLDTTTSCLKSWTTGETQSLVVEVHPSSDMGDFVKVSVPHGALRLGAAYQVTRKGRVLGVIRLRSLWKDGQPAAALWQEGVVQWVGFSSLMVGDQLSEAPQHERPWGEWLRRVPSQGREERWYALCYSGVVEVGQRVQCLRKERHHGYVRVAASTSQPFSPEVGFLVLVDLEAGPAIHEGDLWLA
ncbi:MAG: phosphotransferase [Myxococcales bacterium]|nr:phosphotransferase [Myxococcales bacterium]